MAICFGHSLGSTPEAPRIIAWKVLDGTFLSPNTARYRSGSRFFPAEWQNNLSHTPPDQIGATLGFQGQFINRYGFLNEITAAQYLQTGVLPYARQEAFCSFEAVQNHLNTLKF